MKKQRIVEAIYVLSAVLFVGICIGTRKEEERKVTEVTETMSVPSEFAQGVAERPKVSEPPIQNATVPKQNTDGEQKTENEMDEIEDQMDIVNVVEIKNENYEEYSNEKCAWWFQRKNDHTASGSGESFPIDTFSAYYLDKNVTEDDKVIYLTFDCGYENGFTPALLDTLAEKNVKVMFFVTKDFIVKNPAYVTRMKEEGHLVGNHTVRHLSSPELTPEELEAELNEVARVMEERTGYSLDLFFRPPMGEYSERTLKVTQDMGYTTIFWSIAYYDYDVNNQPGKDYVVDHFSTYHHNGSIVLMHNISESNTQALGDVLDLLVNSGYRFGSLSEIGRKKE